MFRKFISPFLLFLAVSTHSGLAQSPRNVDCKSGFADLIPESSLHTERLVLAPIKECDFAKAVAIYMDPRVSEMSGNQYSAEFFMQLMNSGQHALPSEAASLELLNLAIMNQNGELQGIVQLIGNVRPGSQTKEPLLAAKPGIFAGVGYHFSPTTWGKGIASEATAKVFTYAFDRLKLDGIFAYVEPTNIGSARVLQKQGFVKVASAWEMDHTDHYFLPRAKYLRLKIQKRRQIWKEL